MPMPIAQLDDTKKSPYNPRRKFLAAPAWVTSVLVSLVAWLKRKSRRAVGEPHTLN